MFDHLQKHEIEAIEVADSEDSSTPRLIFGRVVSLSSA